MHQTTESKQTTLSAYSAYDFPSVEALVRYMHAVSGFPVKSLWLRAIKRGNFETWSGLTYSNGAKCFPQAVEMIKGPMVQSSQLVRSTKNKTPAPRSIKRGIFKVAPEEEKMEDIPPPIKIKELHIWYEPISNLYNDDCGHFTIRYSSGNEYIVIAYNCDLNTILQAPFANSKNKHRIRVYSSIMKRLAYRGHQVDVQILDNKVSA